MSISYRRKEMTVKRIEMFKRMGLFKTPQSVSELLNIVEGFSAKEKSAATLSMASAARSIAEKNRQVKESAQTKLGEYGMRDTDQRYQEALAERARKSGAANRFFGGVKELGTEMVSNRENEAWKEKIMNAPWFTDLSFEQQQKILDSL